jgi:hypothetical protein
MAKTPSGKKSTKKIVTPASKKSAPGGKPAPAPPVAKKANPVKATPARAWLVLRRCASEHPLV